MGVPLKFLIAGLGGIGQRHARNLRALLGENVEMLAYRTRRNSPALTDKMQVESGLDVETKFDLRVFTDLAEALAAKPDAAIIANPTSLHLPVAQAAAEAGCHLFIEKPISHTMDGVEEFLDQVEHRNLVTFVGYQWRFHPLLERLKQTLGTRPIGRIVSVLAEFGEYLPGWHPYEDYRESYAARRELGGGVLLTQIHDFDYLGWLFGWPRRVFCSGGKLSTLEIDVEDTANTLLECDMEGRSVPIHVHQDYLQRTPVRGCRIIGEAGKIEVDLAHAAYSIRNECGEEIDAQCFDNFDRNQIFLAEMKHFIACLERREISRVSASEGAKSLRVALAAQESLTDRARNRSMSLAPLAESLFTLAGRVAVVTGGAGLLGVTHCEIIAAAGGIPVLVDLDETKADARANELASRLGVDAWGAQADITQPDEVRGVLDRILRRHGRIDILINNAAIDAKVGKETSTGFARVENFPSKNGTSNSTWD